MANSKVLGGGIIDGDLGENPVFSEIEAGLGRILTSVIDGYLQYWIVEETEGTDWKLLANGLYANKTTLKDIADTDSFKNRQAIKGILVAQGLSGNYGFFADGFTYTADGDIGVSSDNKFYKYVGADDYPVVIAAGTDPDSADYFQHKINTQEVITLEEFGGGENKTKAENKAALQEAIAILDGTAGKIIINPRIDYGYVRATKSTWPDFSSLSSSIDTRIFIEDYSKGSTGGSGRSGAQFRKWYYTGDEQDGQHNGNFEYIKAGWHPGVYISHDGDLDSMKVVNGGAGANRRASLILGTFGDANWRIGQGRITDDTATEEELTQFTIAANNLPDLGVSGLTSCYTINKTNGNQGFNVGEPLLAFDFLSRVGQNSSFGFESQDNEPTFILQGPSGTCRINVKPTSGFSIADASSALYDVSANGAIHKLRRNSAGNPNLEIASLNTQRRISVRDDNSSFNILNSASTSNVFTLTDTGGLSIAGTYSPFTGTHLFFCKEKLEAGCAVDYVQRDCPSYIQYLEVTDQETETVDVPELKPHRKKLETEEQYNDRCTQGYSYGVCRPVNRYEEVVIELNGEVEKCKQKMSKVCCGIVDHQTPMEGGFLTVVAAAGDNVTNNIGGFIVSGGCEAGDILCTNDDGGLMKMPPNCDEAVVRFKALSNPDVNSLVYGYFKS